MSFERLPAVEGSIACLTCGSGAKSDLSMERMIAVGFGDAGYTKDGLGVWSESDAAADSEDDFPVVADVEKLAAADPDHDWRIYFYSPMYEAEYQRQGEGVWVLVKKGEGFA
jgi:hypothetical protein